MAYNNGKMVQDMRESDSKIKDMEMENRYTQTELFMKANSKIILWKDMGYINKMGQNMKVIENKICMMERAKKLGMRDLFIKVFILKE